MEAKKPLRGPLHEPPPTLFTDVREYLKAVYEFRKSTDRNFSYSSWSSELGFRSRAFVRLIIVGKRSITENSIPLFITGLKLSDENAQYFTTLVRFNQATTPLNRERYGMEIARLRSPAGKRLVVRNQLQLMSSHLTPRLQVLLSLDDLERTPKNLAFLLGTTLTETENMLDSLKRLSLAEQDSDGNWQATTKSFEVVDQLGDVALQSFHRKSLEEAVRSMILPVETRRYQCALFPLSESEYADLKEEMMAFLEKTLGRYSKDQGEGRRLYQLNLNLIPVSKPILRSGKSRCASVGDFTQSHPIALHPRALRNPNQG